MKRIISIYLICIFFLLPACIWDKTGCKKSTVREAFPVMFESDEFATRITAIIMAAEFRKTELTQNLLNLLSPAEGIEKVAVLYSLCKAESDDYTDEFIKAIPDSEKGIKELLDVESPRKSYFASPKLRIIDYLGAMAIHDDEAFSKLTAISRYADGWQGDAVMELIENVKN